MLKNKGREFRGCQPYSVGLLEKSRSKNGRRENGQDEVKSVQNQSFENWKAKWEDELFQVKVKNLTNLRFKAAKAHQNKLLEEKRDELHQMLHRERDGYAQETLDRVETREDRINRLRKDVADVRRKYEEEKSELVREKREEQFINSADPLRRLKQNYAEFEIKRNRDHQVMAAAEVRAEERREAQFWDDLMLKNWTEEGEREVIKERERAAKNREIQNFLDAQIEERMREMSLQQQKDPKLINDLMEDAKLEEREKYQAKVEKQREMKFLLDKSLELKNRRVIEETTEELEFEERLLEENRETEGREIEWQSLRKRELAREMETYLNYLRESGTAEKLREEEILEYVRQKEREINEIGRQKRLAEKQKRQKIYDSIAEFREQHRKIKEMEAERETREKVRARNELAEDLAELERERNEEVQRAKEGKNRRKEEILAQIAHNDEMRREKERKKYLEDLEMKESEREYMKKMQEIMEREAK